MCNYDRIAKVLAAINDKDLMLRFMEEILTPAERRDLELRWELMTLLHEQIPQREIANKLGISLCKITRGAKVLKDKSSVTSRIMNNQISLSATEK